MLYQKLKKSFKKTLQTIIPHQIPEFGVNDAENPLFFAYFINGDIFHISHEKNLAFSEVVIDEVVKVGFENGEFAFYPVGADSAFFKQDFELDTFRFIELILLNNLNEIAREIYALIAKFEAKILDYEMLYKLKLKNAICNVDFADSGGILALSENLKWELESAIKATLIELASQNLLDCKQNIFNALFKDGIYDFENIAENIAWQDILKHYYNHSNLSDNIEKSLEIKLNKMRFFISYFTTNIFLELKRNGIFFINAEILLNGIYLLGSPNINYANADLKIEFDGENIHISNLQKLQVILYEIKSKLSLQGAESTFNFNEQIALNESVTLKNSSFLEVKSSDKISHKLELIYSVDGTEKRFVGSASVKWII